MINLDLKLVETQDQIVAKILKAIANHLRIALRAAKPEILKRVKEVVERAITTSPEYHSLMGGQLQGELGVPEPHSRIDQLLAIWLNEIQIIEKPVRIVADRIVGGFRIEVIKRNLRAVLNSPASSYVTEKGETIPWLRWLTLMGDAVIVRDYSVDFSNPKNSRTGLAVMVGDTGSNWFVPPEYSGTIDNNFVTRALKGVIPTISAIIEEEVVKEVMR